MHNLRLDNKVPQRLHHVAGDGKIYQEQILPYIDTTYH